jgi:hypothetical protein
MNKNQLQNDVTSPQVITPASPLNPITQLVGYLVQVAGTGGSLTFNDCATLAQASIANQILTIPYNQVIGAAGFASALNLPVQNGLVVSSVPTGGVYSVLFAIYVPG